MLNTCFNIKLMAREKRIIMFALTLYISLQPCKIRNLSRFFSCRKARAQLHEQHMPVGILASNHNSQ